MMIPLWIGIGVLVVWGLRAFSKPDTAPQRRPQHSAQDIVAQRYARGEITRDEYLAMLDNFEYEDESDFNKQKRNY